MPTASPVPQALRLQTTKPSDNDFVAPAGQGSIDAMSFAELNTFVDARVNHISGTLQALLPAIQRVHDALCCQGRRTDLLDAPPELTWEDWMESKREILGSRSKIFRLLAQAKRPKLLTAGAKVRVGSGKAETVVKVEAEYKEGEPKEISLGDLIIFTDEDTTYQYRYEGHFAFGPREKIQNLQKIAKPNAKRLALVAKPRAKAKGSAPVPEVLQ